MKADEYKRVMLEVRRRWALVQRAAVIGIAFIVVVITVAIGEIAVTSNGGPVSLDAQLHLLQLQHERAVLSAELDTCRADLEQARSAAGPAYPPEKADAPTPGMQDSDPKSGFGDCAIPWMDILNQQHGRRQLVHFGVAVEVVWRPRKPEKP